MEPDKSILLQKQVRDNSEDLQSEFLDMKNWEKQMKKADSEIRNVSVDQILPSIRKKKKSPKETQLPKNKINSGKRIKSSDYSSWDKFDVKKACKALDESERSDSEEEPLSQEELQRNHTQATEHKVQGNIFVQQRQWLKAIDCYDKAIKVFPYDAVFFANRAICYLNTDNFHSAEADCTAAIQLDECYVKAYHRRATARYELKQYREAAEDVQKILQLEPSNKHAHKMLAYVDKLIANSKEKACKALDESKPSDSGEKPLSQEELQRNHTQATEHKVQGNIFVKQRQWLKAIDSYDIAIKVFPFDAVFFANRALCYLNTKNFQSAEADCTAALQLDECYVKAYHRRATARYELKQYREAAEDVQQILKLEPSNKHAHEMLAFVNKLIANSKPPTLSSKPAEVAQPKVEKNIVEECKTETLDANQIDMNFQKTMKTSVVEKFKKELIHVNAEVDDKVARAEQTTDVDIKLPDWLPEIHENIGIVKVITKAPHQRSKKPLRTIPIEEIEFGAKKPSVKNTPAESSRETITSDTDKKVASKDISTEKIPEVPKTSMQFLSTWRNNKSTEFRYKYFKHIPAERIPTIFEDSMESNTFSEILKILRLEFVKLDEPIFDYLRYLSQVKRFRTLTMFMSKSDKEDLRALFDYSEKQEKKGADEIKDLIVTYEM